MPPTTSLVLKPVPTPLSLSVTLQQPRHLSTSFWIYLSGLLFSHIVPAVFSISLPVPSHFLGEFLFCLCPSHMLISFTFVLFCFVRHCSGPSLLTLRFTQGDLIYFASIFWHPPDLHLQTISLSLSSRPIEETYWPSTLGHFTGYFKLRVSKSQHYPTLSPSHTHPASHWSLFCVPILVIGSTMAMAWQFVCLPPTKFICWSIIPNVKVFEGGALGRYLGLDEVMGVDPPRWVGMVPPRWDRTLYLSHEDTARRWSSAGQEAGSHQTHPWLFAILLVKLLMSTPKSCLNPSTSFHSNFHLWATFRSCLDNCHSFLTSSWILVWFPFKLFTPSMILPKNNYIMSLFVNPFPIILWINTV